MTPTPDPPQSDDPPTPDPPPPRLARRPVLLARRPPDPTTAHWVERVCVRCGATYRHPDFNQTAAEMGSYQLEFRRNSRVASGW